MAEIYEFPGGGWLIDKFKASGQWQLSISKGINKDKDGNDVDIQTMQEAKNFYTANKTFLNDKMVLLGTPGKQEPGGN